MKRNMREGYEKIYKLIEELDDDCYYYGGHCENKGTLLGKIEVIAYEMLTTVEEGVLFRKVCTREPHSNGRPYAPWNEYFLTSRLWEGQKKLSNNTRTPKLIEGNDIYSVKFGIFRGEIIWVKCINEEETE